MNLHYTSVRKTFYRWGYAQRDTMIYPRSQARSTLTEVSIQCSLDHIHIGNSVLNISLKNTLHTLLIQNRTVLQLRQMSHPETKRPCAGSSPLPPVKYAALSAWFIPIVSNIKQNYCTVQLPTHSSTSWLIFNEYFIYKIRGLLEKNCFHRSV